MGEKYITYEHKVYPRFEDTDAYGIIHHSRYLTYIEEAKIAFLSDKKMFDSDVIDEKGGKFPVLDLYIKYIKAVHYKSKEPILIKLKFIAVENIKIKFEFKLFYENQKIVVGEMTHVYIDSNDKLRFDIPEKIKSRYETILNEKIET